MDYIFSFLEINKEDCQFSLDGILADYDGPRLSTDKIIYAHLQENYSSDVLMRMKLLKNKKK